ncbi:hypothetical protein ACR777_14150 [Sphingobacterium spiritivorum]|uniref:hypothetical protein n=1 Tax=Sphingobacterium spiritivorum TaxID=258 RepID=UPI003DA1C9FE
MIFPDVKDLFIRKLLDESEFSISAKGTASWDENSPDCRIMIWLFKSITTLLKHLFIKLNLSENFLNPILPAQITS